MTRKSDVKKTKTDKNRLQKILYIHILDKEFVKLYDDLMQMATIYNLIFDWILPQTKQNRCIFI